MLDKDYHLHYVWTANERSIEKIPEPYKLVIAYKFMTNYQLGIKHAKVLCFSSKFVLFLQEPALFFPFLLTHQTYLLPLTSFSWEWSCLISHIKNSPQTLPQITVIIFFLFPLIIMENSPHANKDRFFAHLLLPISPHLSRGHL